jgi:hypothetical protein
VGGSVSVFLGSEFDSGDFELAVVDVLVVVVGVILTDESEMGPRVGTIISSLKASK